MADKWCGKCELFKSEEEFALQKKGGHLRVCYCFTCRRELHRVKSQTLRSRWRQAKARSIQRKGDGWWTITEEQFCDMITKNCNYCDGPLGTTGSGLDRMCNDKGYHIDNVVPCCKSCNITKNEHYTYEEMMMLAPTLKQIRLNRLNKGNSDE